MRTSFSYGILCPCLKVFASKTFQRFVNASIFKYFNSRRNINRVIEPALNPGCKNHIVTTDYGVL